jgi:hypothetical protein
LTGRLGIRLIKLVFYDKDIKNIYKRKKRTVKMSDIIKKTIEVNLTKSAISIQKLEENI